MKLHQRFFLLLIFLLPVQLGFHFWPASAYVFGLRIDYLSFAIYLTDVLLFLTLVTFFIEEKKTFNFKAKVFLKRNWKVLVFCLFLFINCLLSADRFSSFFKLFKLFEFFLLFLYVSKAKLEKQITARLFLYSCSYVSLIGIIQFFKKASIGGVFWWLGERSFTISTPGIAKMSFTGELFLRPYSILPHPNVLAGFLLVSFLLFLSLTKKISFNLFSLALIVPCFVFTASRSAFLGLFAVFCFFVFKRLGFKKTAFFVLLILIAGLFLIDLKPLFESTAFLQRIQLARISLNMFLDNPFSGVGLNNFIPSLSDYFQKNNSFYLFQPVHNLFLLVLSETGLIGLIGFIFGLGLALKKSLKNVFLFLGLVVIVITGFFDHYWLTLQQPMILFSVAVGLSFRK